MNDTVVLIPYFKRQDALLKTLASMRGEIPGFDVLIVDDGSPVPLTLDTAQYSFPIKVIRMHENKGSTEALNTGLRDILSMSYSFVARMDVADFWVPGRLTAQRRFLLEHADYGLVGSCATALKPDGTLAFDWDLPLTDEKIRQFINFNNAFIHPAVMMKTAIIRKAGLYSDRFDAAEDYEYFRRLLTLTKAENLPERWVKYEMGLPGQSISVDKQRAQIQSVIRIQLKYFNPLAWRAYAGLAYKLLHLYAPRAAEFLKRKLRRLVV